MRVAVAILLDNAGSSDVAEEIERLLEAQGGGYGLLAEATDESIVSSDEAPTLAFALRNWGTSAGISTLASSRMLTVGAVEESSLTPLVIERSSTRTETAMVLASSTSALWEPRWRRKRSVTSSRSCRKRSRT
jgi:hypothetical protein